MASNATLHLTVNGSPVSNNDDILVMLVETLEDTPRKYPLDNTGVPSRYNAGGGFDTHHYLIVASKTEFQIGSFSSTGWYSGPNGFISPQSEYDTKLTGTTAIPTTYGHKTPFSEYLDDANSYNYTQMAQSFYVEDGDVTFDLAITTASGDKNISYNHIDGDGYFSVSPASPISLGNGVNLELTITPATSYRFAQGTQKISVGGHDYDVVVDVNTGNGSVVVSNEDLTDGDVVVFNITMEEIPVQRRNFYTVYAPTPQNLVAINNAIFLDNGGATVDVSQYFSSYRKFWCNLTLSGNSRELMAGRYDFGQQSPTIDDYIQTIDCGSIDIEEVKKSLVDYNPYSRIVIYLPFIGFNNIQTSEFMGRKLRVQYKVDVLNGRCLAELYTDIISPETCVAQYQGTIASDEIFGLDNGFSYDGTYEVMATNQLGGLVPFVLIYTKNAIDADIKNYDGLPASEEKIVGNCDGFVKFDSIKVEGTNAKKSEIDKIETLLLNGIYV